MNVTPLVDVELALRRDADLERVHVGVDERTLDLEAVMTYLGEQHAIDPYRRLVLRADAGLKYGDVREFMARVQQVGFPGVNFMVGEKHKPGQGPAGDDPQQTAAGRTAPTAPGSEG